MSDTPRTDKETGKSMGSDSIVYASFARQLERELTEAREQRDRLAEALRTLMFNSLRYRMESYDASYQEAEAALAGMEGGSDE
jgi:hypothetical protein